MQRGLRWGWPLLAMVGGALLAFQASNQAQDKIVHKHDASALYPTLKEVIDYGAILYNAGDYPGSYRVFQGSLLTVKPFLAPDLKKGIDDALRAAEAQPTFAHRAWELRKALDLVRAAAKGDAPARTEEKVKEKKIEPEEKTEPAEVLPEPKAMK